MVPNCNRFYFVHAGDSCAQISADHGISFADLLAWNPSVKSDCTGLWAEVNVCVGVIGHTPTTTIPSTTTTTRPTNGVTTPTPYQDGMATNCNKFYQAKAGDNCYDIAKAHNIDLSNFYAWNKALGGDCSGLWAEYNYCVGLIGGPTKPPTPTTTGNGIATPTPTQPGMVNNCDAFHKVKSGDTCAAIASQYGISVGQLTTWNPQVGASCTGMWLDYYICVSVVGVEPTKTNNNGVATPTPTQVGMVKNCKTFHLVKSGETCASIAKQAGISTQQFISWNPAAKSDCTGLWSGTYACIGLI